ncbi:hypothetical protein [Mycobacterium asiaticum]|uniref:PPE-PPW subfamily C-terminal domain-containing protein n=1 Tax=Mycobacterium asiaticum TaxID=1790 RepID=A0A1A3MNH6_MYCAS|nr:hypothetical protein A5636_15210 [Mycobacterium asiaticum]
MGVKASTGAKRQAEQPDTSAAAAPAAASAPGRARRRRQARQRRHDDEFMDMNVDVDPEWAPQSSARGAGQLGFAGTLRNENIGDAAGLVTLASGEFGGGVNLPMLPGSWTAEDDLNPPR